ncbi:MAG: DNA translocase FtsK 4TM domain-containing protein, partial [Aquamicrobium sp.]|uniref:DNA translocase FtsK 4TM domain-containing protein n=1 Tax=Aquamicrobium sp. TaxID=1872579 RepID=UPI00349E6F38|nr:DNA translocase FtsK 4TM domain-containing protein [Aquamicrobium sp.]
MRSNAAAQLAIDETAYGLRGFLHRQMTRAAGVAVLGVTVFCFAALATWNVADPSFSHATDNPVTNAGGYPGAVVADLLMQFLGLGAVVGLVPAAVWGSRLVAARRIDRMPARAAAWAGAAVLGAGVIGCIVAPPTWPLPSGLGGVIGDLALGIPSWLAGGYPTGAAAILTVAVFIGPALWLLAFASVIIGRPASVAAAESPAPARRRQAARPMEEDFDDEDEDDEDRAGFLVAAMGAVTHWWLAAQGFVRRRLGGAVRDRRRGIVWDDDDGMDDLPVSRPAARRAIGHGARVEPGFDAAPAHDDEPPFEVGPAGRAPADFDDDEDFDEDDVVIRPTPAHGAQAAEVRHFRSDAATRVEAPAPRPQQGARVQREAQRSLIGPDSFEMPSLHFLAEAKNVTRDPSLSQDALEQNARLLEGVLEDFGVKGEIIHVRPGPVVTLYEL